jgi:hypothetical protein
MGMHYVKIPILLLRRASHFRRLHEELPDLRVAQRLQATSGISRYSTKILDHHKVEAISFGYRSERF